MAKRAKKFWEQVKLFLKPPKVRDIIPKIQKRDPWKLRFMANEEESMHRENMENIALTELEVQRDTANHNLSLQHRMMIITLLAVVIALFSSVAAIIIARSSKPPQVIVKPVIINSKQ